MLLAGVNDSPGDARKFARLLYGIPSKVNLIPWNSAPNMPFTRPTDEAIEAFRQVLVEQHISAFLRQSKGEDVLGACGQLANQAVDRGS